MRSRRRERGQGLLTALLVLLLVSTAAALVATALHRQMRLVRQEAAALELRALADSALAEALAELDRDRYFAGASDHPFGTGEIGSTVDGLGTNLWLVHARAHRGGRTRGIQAEVRRVDGRLRVVAWRRLGAGETGG